MLQESVSVSRFTRLQWKSSVIILLILWLLGFVCGLYFVSSEYDLFYGYMTKTVLVRQSVWGILTVIYNPLIVCSICIYFSAPVIIYIYCAFKAFCFSCCLCCVAMIFGQSAWLVRLLLFFSDNWSVLLTLWLSGRFLLDKSAVTRKDILFCTIILTAIGLADYFLVSPYTALLMNYS